MKKVLGKGLDSLIPQDSSGQIREIDINLIIPNKYQMRSNFDDGKIRELADTIKKKGLFQPVVVTPEGKKYMLIAGERRLRAARLAGLREIPCIERKLDGEDALVLSLIENIQRENLAPLEEAAAYERMAGEFSMTQKEISEKVGKSRSTVANTMRLLSLPEDLIELVASGKLTPGHARAILSVENPDKRKNLASKIVREKLTVREAEAIAAGLTGASKRRKSRAGRGSAPGEVKKMEESLEKALGTKVRIKLKKTPVAVKGSVEIEFYSLDDFERIAGIICGRKRAVD